MVNKPTVDPHPCTEPDLFLCSCSRRSCSSFSRCSRACLRFSARMRAASSGSVVPADGLPAGVETTAGDAAEAVGSTLGAAGEAADTTGGPREGGVAGAEDTVMAGTLPETVREKTAHV